MSPDEDDWVKIKCVCRYLEGTKYMKLKVIISVENVSLMKWWVETSTGARMDCKYHTLLAMRVDLNWIWSAYLKAKWELHRPPWWCNWRFSQPKLRWRDNLVRILSVQLSSLSIHHSLTWNMFYHFYMRTKTKPSKTETPLVWFLEDNILV